MIKIVDQMKNKAKKAVEDTMGYLGNLYKSGKNFIDKSVVQPVKDLFTPDATAMGPANTYSGELTAAGSPIIGTADNGVVGSKNGNGEDFNTGDFAPVGGDSSEGGTETEVGTVTPSATPYLDYLNKAETNIREYSKYLEELAEDEKKNALEEAETEFQRASVDANAAYQRNLATYGAKAEALDRMGLNGSGYSDYLAGNAYSEMRNDIGLATGEKNAAEQAANKKYSKAMRDAAIYEKDKLNELNLERATYSENLIKENEAKKQTLKSELMTMAQSGVSAADIQNYINASGTTFTTDEITALGAISNNVIGRMKSEIIAGGLTGNMSAESIQAVAKANGISLSEPEIEEYKTALSAIRADIKTEEDKANALNIASLILSSDSVDANVIKGLLEMYGFDPSTGTGAALMSLAPEGSIVKTGYASSPGVVDSSNAGKILSDMKAHKSLFASNKEGGNITVEYNGEKYYLQKNTADRIPEDDDTAVALTDSYRLKNNLSVEEWIRKEDTDIEGTVVQYKGGIYAYLKGDNGKYGWFELEPTWSARDNPEKKDKTYYGKLSAVFNSK